MIVANFDPMINLASAAFCYLLVTPTAYQQRLRDELIDGIGMPRFSPGTELGGQYVSKGRWFADTLRFHSKRFLPREHPHHDSQFGRDAVGSFAPFSLRPRGCLGSNPAPTAAEDPVSQARVDL
ncbi:hypothetical protein PspLS_06999 [Pyricularia sp. CBS 133598]|nr:hypothetical protein PspLS_06999 [Pyricularia sp. CBS 133598]